MGTASMTNDSTNLGGGVDRRTYIKSVAGTGLLGSVAGCTGSQQNSQSNETTTTTVGTPQTSGDWPDLSGKEFHFVSGEPSEAAQQYWGRVTEDFKEATGAEIRLEFTQAGQSGQDRIIQLLQAGDPPNIYPTFIGRTLQFYRRGILRPLTDITQKAMDQWGEPRDVFRVVVDDDDYMFPQWASFSLHWYRSDASDIVPDTWEKALAYAEETDENGGVKGTYVPTGLGPHSDAELLTYAWANDCKTFERDNDGNLRAILNKGSNRDRWVELMNWKSEMHNHSPVASDSSWTTCINAIANETSHSGWYGGVRPKNAVIEQNKPFAGETHATIPQKRSTQTYGTASGLVSFKGADPEVTDTFLDFWTQERYLNPLYWEFSRIHNVPSWPKIKDGEYYQQKVEQLPPEWTRDDLEFYINEAPKHAKVWAYETEPKNPYTGTVFSSQILSNFKYDVLVDDQDPDKIIDSYNQKLQEVINQAQG